MRIWLTVSRYSLLDEAITGYGEGYANRGRKGQPLAGKPAPADSLINVETLLDQYYSVHPEPENPLQQVSFGTSGHRGTSANGTFNEDHILAVSQAVVEYRKVRVSMVPYTWEWTPCPLCSRSEDSAGSTGGAGCRGLHCFR